MPDQRPEQISNRQQNLKLNFYESVIIIGCGGIGSWAAINLALSGCTAVVHLIDDDTVELTNLNRTPFRLCDVGNYKVDALKYMVLERRADIIVNNYQSRTNPELKKKILDTIHDIKDCAVIDCRDDALNDFYDLDCPYYKVGYDGFSITFDNDPRKTPIWGRANGYRFTPSYICPAQMAACLVVNDLLTRDKTNPDPEQVYVTFDIRNLLSAVNKLEEEEQNGTQTVNS